MKALLPLLLLLPIPVLAYPVCGEPVKIAVIDTGFRIGKGNDSKIKLCNSGHRDLSGVNKLEYGKSIKIPIPTDETGHGTNIAGLVDRYARTTGVNYCIVIIKYYDVKLPYRAGGQLIEAIKYAHQIKADIVNVSAGGIGYVPEEGIAVKKYLDDGGVFVSAAGNEKANLSREAYYPAQDDKRVIVVGNLTESYAIESYSNYGKRVNAWEIGTHQEALGFRMTGTSQATAVHTGKMISYFQNNCSKIKKIAKSEK